MEDNNLPISVDIGHAVKNFVQKTKGLELAGDIIVNEVMQWKTYYQKKIAILKTEIINKEIEIKNQNKKINELTKLLDRAYKGGRDVRETG